MHKYVYLFTEGNADMRELLGGKGANLAEMTNIGFINLSHILANITASFGGTPILTPPAPTQNATVIVK